MEVARISRNHDFECVALENLGHAYYGLKDFGKAQENYEMHLQLVLARNSNSNDATLSSSSSTQAQENSAEIQAAMVALSTVYEEIALQHEENREFENAIRIYTKFLDVTCVIY